MPFPVTAWHPCSERSAEMKLPSSLRRGRDAGRGRGRRGKAQRFIHQSVFADHALRSCCCCCCQPAPPPPTTDAILSSEMNGLRVTVRGLGFRVLFTVSQVVGGSQSENTSSCVTSEIVCGIGYEFNLLRAGRSNKPSDIAPTAPCLCRRRELALRQKVVQAGY